MKKKQKNITLRAGGIIVASLFVALFITPVLTEAQGYGSYEEIACTSSGGSYYLNVDCNSGGLPDGFMSSCWICEPGSPPPPTCVPNSACAADTCVGSSCSDSCPNTYAGTKSCPVPPPTCQDYGYNYGTVGCCYNNADRSDDGCYDVCPATPGNQSSYSQCNCTDNPSGPGCNTQPTCTNNSYCSGTTYISSDTCNGQTGSTPNSPSCGYVAPPSCTPSSACAASTPVGNVCYDSCGNGYAGTYVAACVPSSACAASTPVGNVCYDSCLNAYAGTYVAGCGTPSATLTAAPTRVRNGQTSTLTLSATGVTTSCTITGPGINSVTAASSCGVSKTIVTPAITSQVTYKVTCDASVDLAKVIVNLVPKVIEF